MVQGAPPSGPSPPPPGKPAKRRRVIAWGALGAFGLAVSGVVIAVNRGQDVCEVSATGIKFCDTDDDRSAVEQSQPQLEQQASELVDDARDDAAAAQPPRVDLSGTWTGDNGFTYVIEQYGDQAVMTEVGFDGMTTAVASGNVDESRFDFDFQSIDGSLGTGLLDLDGNTLRGVFENATLGISTPAVLRR